MTPEERAARERKQKIFVLLGGLLLVALLAFQLPKLMGGGGSSSPEAATTTDAASTLAAQTVVPTTHGVPTAAPGLTPAVLATAKLTSFSVFERKDPFVQQAVTDIGAQSTTTRAGEVTGKGAKGETPTATFSTGGKAASATIVTVNGARQVLEPGMKFPAGDPLFVLVAENPAAKSAVVGIVGGAYARGGKTTALKVGTPITLVNTTTGARYKITLVSVGNGEQPAPAGNQATQGATPQAGK